MQHIRETIAELRRYIAKKEAGAELEEVDALLAVALEEVGRKLGEKGRAARVQHNRTSNGAEHNPDGL